MNEPTLNLEQIKAQIDALPREDRANLRPWILAHYDVDGSKHRRIHDLKPAPGEED
jgi:hypothetical protein